MLGCPPPARAAHPGGMRVLPQLQDPPAGTAQQPGLIEPGTPSAAFLPPRPAQNASSGHGGGHAPSPMLAPTSMPMHGPTAAPGAGVAPAATRLCRGARVAGEEQRGWPPAPGSRTPQKVPRPEGARPQGPLCCPAGATPGPGSATGAAPGVPTGCSGGPCASCSPSGLSPRGSHGHGAGRASLWRFPVSPRPFPKSL